MTAARPVDYHVVGKRVVVGAGGVVLHNAAVSVRGDRIVAVGPVTPQTPPLGGRTYGTVLPGLIDPHVHLAFRAGSAFAPYAGPVAEAVAVREAVGTMMRLTERGVTTVRDLGCPGHLLGAIRRELERSPRPSPRLLASSRPITTPNGHLSGIGRAVVSKSDARGAVAECAADGADVIKVIVTGGRLTPGTPMGRASLPREVLDAVVAAARRLSLPVAAHVHGTEGIALAVRAGVDTLEHCSWTDLQGRVRGPAPGVVDEIRDRNQVIVTAGPLCAPLVRLAVDEVEWERIAARRRIRRQLKLWRNADLARQRGVTVSIGTDSLFGAFEDDSDLAARAVLMTRVGGWAPLDVLEAVTGSAALACARQGDIGRLAVGAIADVVAFDGDVLADLASLRHPALVLREGAVAFHLGAGSVTDTSWSGAVLPIVTKLLQRADPGGNLPSSLTGSAP